MSLRVFSPVLPPWARWREDMSYHQVRTDPVAWDGGNLIVEAKSWSISVLEKWHCQWYILQSQSRRYGIRTQLALITYLKVTWLTMACEARYVDSADIQPVLPAWQLTWTQGVPPSCSIACGRDVWQWSCTLLSDLMEDWVFKDHKHNKSIHVSQFAIDPESGRYSFPPVLLRFFFLFHVNLVTFTTSTFSSTVQPVHLFLFIPCIASHSSTQPCI